MNSLLGMTPDEITESLDLKQAFRGRQIFKDLHKNGKSIAEMTTLSQTMKDSILSRIGDYTATLVRTQTSNDGTVKIAIKLADDSVIEAVLLKDGKDRLTACLSTQVGCAMGCTFCQTGTMGLIRNLEPAEIIQQFYIFRREYGDISNIVFMGMGEPLDNYDNVVKAIRILGHPDGLNYSPRRITVSTCGLEAGIRRLANEFPQVKLAVSLNTAVERKRLTLMPVTRTTGIELLKKTLLEYQNLTGKRFTLEYVLLPGENDSHEDVKALVNFAGGLNCLVNLIPWNPAKDLSFRESTQSHTENFKQQLEKKGIKVTLRMRKGVDIDGACGQLASES